MDEIVRRLRESRYDELGIDELIRLAQNGDSTAMELVLTHYKPLVYRMTNKYFPPNASYDKEDIEMIAMEALWKAIEQFDGGDFESFAGMKIRNKLSDWMKGEAAEKRTLNYTADYLDTPVASDGEGGEATLGDTLPSKSLSAEEDYIGQEGYNAIMDYIRTLSDLEREAILRKARGQKVSEIAEETGMPAKKVDNALNRAKGKIADFVKSKYNEARGFRRGEVEFTPEEAKVLEDIITKINREERIAEARKVRRSRVLVESAGYAVVRAEDEDMTIEDFLTDIEMELDEIEAELADVPHEARENYDDMIDDIIARIRKREDEMTDEEYYHADDLRYRASKLVAETDYDGPMQPEDPYAERGIRRSDFY